MTQANELDPIDPRALLDQLRAAFHEAYESEREAGRLKRAQPGPHDALFDISSGDLETGDIQIYLDRAAQLGRQVAWLQPSYPPVVSLTRVSVGLRCHVDCR